jgi:catechol 2,3-dioxygenase
MTFAIDPGVALGHATLQVADLERALPFYEDVLGLRVVGRLAGRVALLGAGARHHHVALSTGRPQLALRYPTRAALAAAARHVEASGVAFTDASDHGIAEAICVEDPDGNLLALSCDRPPERWPRTASGNLAVVSLPLDLERLLGA